MQQIDLWETNKECKPVDLLENGVSLKERQMSWESKLWKAVCAYQTMLIEEPFGGAHEEMIPAWLLGRKLGIPDVRIKHFCKKWVMENRWMTYGSMCGSFDGYEKPNVSS